MSLIGHWSCRSRQPDFRMSTEPVEGQWNDSNGSALNLNFMRPDATGDNRLRGQFWVLLALVTVDVVSKLMAFLLLSSESGDDSESVIQWQLAINPVGLGGAGRRLVGDHGANLVLVGAVLCAEIACALAVLVRKKTDGPQPRYRHSGAGGFHPGGDAIGRSGGRVSAR
jgi:hypothetical protein